MALKFKVKVPGTSANIGVGYDCLGVALDYHLELEVEESDKIEFLENGKSFSIPIEDNYIFEAIKYYYVMIPDFKLSTEKARSVLPKSYLVSDVINNMAKLGLLVNDLNNGKYDNLRFLLGDKLHQPYRYALINNSQEIFEATKRYGALGEYISGAGPTLMALNYNNDDFLNKMKEFLNTLPDRWTIDKKKVNLKGAEVFDIENV